MMSIFFVCLYANVSQPVCFCWLIEWLAGLGLCVLEGENDYVSLFAILEKTCEFLFSTVFS